LGRLTNSSQSDGWTHQPRRDHSHHAGCASALFYGFKRDLNAYLASLGAGAPVHTLSDVIAYNAAHSAEALKYGQILAQLSDSIDISPGSADTAQYTDSRAQDLRVRAGDETPRAACQHAAVAERCGVQSVTGPALDHTLPDEIDNQLAVPILSAHRVNRRARSDVACKHTGRR